MNIKEILLRLEEKYPTIETALNYTTDFELLFAVILSAQCTDKRVNIVTRDLFAKYKTVEDYADADIEELKKIIYSTGFYNNKAKNIIGAAKMLEEKFDSKVPDTIENLIMLPGVARKTANVVLSIWHGKNEGIAVDTHVKRISKRLGLTEETDPKKVEKDLLKKIPKEKLGEFSLRLVEFGRDTCKAKKPDCENCVLNDICPGAFKFGK
ncbi:endonuclease III [Candidatus Dojkabacteria bacterium]|nr:endonuclease III [Candidatus Dojkabacteria bacterium]